MKLGLAITAIEISPVPGRINNGAVPKKESFLKIENYSSESCKQEVVKNACFVGYSFCSCTVIIHIDSCLDIQL